MGKICVTPLGWTEDELTLGAVRRLRGAKRIFLKTARCGAAEWLADNGIPFDAFDALYDEADDFDELTERIVSALMEASEDGDVLYGVNDPGDVTCAALAAAAPEKVELTGGVNEGSALGALTGGCHSQLNAIDCADFPLNASQAALVREIDNAILAGEVKLRLMEVYPEEWEIVVLTADGALRRMPLCELDRLEVYDHRVCALIPAVRELTEKERFSFDDLNRIMRRLRAFDGDLWDREQTHASLRPYLIEEAYEAADAIDSGDTDALYDELGDVLLQVAFHAEIAREYGEFDASDVTTAICRKMIDRHPHVFGRARCDAMEDIVGQWERLKMKERALDSKAQALGAITRSLPALMRAAKTLKKAAFFGFPVGLGAETVFPDSFESEEAAGDFLLEAARRVSNAGIDAELALSRAVDRLVAWAGRMEEAAAREGVSLDALSQEELILRRKRAQEDRKNAQ